MKIAEIAKIIDHTNIEQNAKEADIKKTCNEAKKYGFRGVCVNPKWARTAKKELKNTDIKVIVLIDGPMGLSLHKERMTLAKKAKKDGANELDVVINVVDVKCERYSKVLSDLKEICAILPTKVIIGTGYLTDEEVRKASEIVKKAGGRCVKTSTFKDPLDSKELKEKAKHLKIMRKSAPGLEIKAAGSIKTLKDAMVMLKAGADIIGTSSGVEIVKEAESK